MFSRARTFTHLTTFFEPSPAPAQWNAFPIPTPHSNTESVHLDQPGVKTGNYGDAIAEGYATIREDPVSLL